jgi:flagellar biosynthesis protein FlhF
MRLRKFSGPTPREALVAVKAALGPEAVILATRPLAAGGVEITAAVDLDRLEAAAADATAAPMLPTGFDAAPVLAAITRELGVLAARVARVDRALAPGAGCGLDEEAQSVAERLALNGTTPALAEAVARSFAHGRQDGLAREAALAACIERHLVVAAPALPEPRVTAFVGPTGCGKTTTIAKLAARAVARGASVGLVGADGHRIGAREQLATYARLLDVPMRPAADGGDLVAALAELAACDLVYVDTAGLGGDAQDAAALTRLLAPAGGVVATAAVVSASASEAALRAAWRHLGPLVPTRGVVTKVDEGGGLGTACGWLADVGVPLDWIGTGTRVPEDIAAADGAVVAAWLTAA